jgi:hypothetical protein
LCRIFMPCPSIGQIVLEAFKLVWTSPNCFGLDQKQLSTIVSHFKPCPKCLGLSKTILTCPKYCFGPIEGQGNSAVSGSHTYIFRCLFCDSLTKGERNIFILQVHSWRNYKEVILKKIDKKTILAKHITIGCHCLGIQQKLFPTLDTVSHI